jgi:Fic-DOC domain mobile mystery protein B
LELSVSVWSTRPGETPIDPSDYKIEVRTRAEADQAEIKNILKAFEKYFLRKRPTRQMAPFNLKWVKRLHAEMFGDVFKFAGKTRKEQLNIGVNWYEIDERLQRLLDDLAYWDGMRVDVIEQSARLHHQAVKIHPFKNGNGRWARMLANIFLRMRDYSHIHWPEDRIIGTESEIRMEYLAALKAADESDFEPLLRLHRSYVRPLPGNVMVSTPRRRIPRRGPIIVSTSLPSSPPEDPPKDPSEDKPE